jgi:predicted glutamine amidotransferase
MQVARCYFCSSSIVFRFSDAMMLLIDGFGVAWYDCDDNNDDTPVLFKSTQTAWSNRNFIEVLCSLIDTGSSSSMDRSLACSVSVVMI